MDLRFSTVLVIVLFGHLFFIACTLSQPNNMKPRFTKSSISYEQNIGEITKLKCCELDELSGPAYVTWFRFKRKLRVRRYRRFRIRKTGKTVMLRIKDTRKEDAGEYECRAKNKFGSASCKVNLTVIGTKKPLGTPGKGPPWFTVPKRARVRFFAWPASSDAKLKCGADGEPPLRYQWLKNGKPLLYRRLDPKVNSTRWFLRLKTAVPSDSGRYMCVVSNRLGNISRSFTLSIMERTRTKPVLAAHFPTNKTAQSGSNVTFQCVELVSPSVTDYRWIHWRKLPSNYPDLKIDTDLLHNSSADYRVINAINYKSFQLKIGNNPENGVRLYLSNVSKEDAGMYSCLASNSIGSSHRSAFLIIDDTVRTTPAKKIVSNHTQEPPSTRKIKSDDMDKSSVIAIIVLCIVIVLTLVCVSVFIVCYKKKVRENVKAAHERLVDFQKESLANTLFDIDGSTRHEIVKLTSYGKRTSRLESNSSTSSTMPLVGFNRQNSVRSRLPSGGGRVDPDISEGEIEIAYDEKWEIDESQLSIKEEPLGEGAFGLVMEAEAFDLPGYPKRHTVAVKMLKHDATELELADLVSEMETMKRIGSHKNIINLMGCCTQNGAAFLYVVVEYAPYGNLRQFLRDRRPSAQNALPIGDQIPKPVITMRDFISFAFQISRGMEHLTAKKCIHRDLAARNILVGEDYVMKIADFGLARHTRDMDYYRKTTDGRLPVKWLAIEALFDRVYTIQSDVWAFGVLLWEIYTLGGSPYPGIPVEKLFELLKSGYRMEKPQSCPLQVYEIMLQTWSENPIYRPSFSDLVQQLEKMLSNLTSQEYVHVVANSFQNISDSSESDCSSTNRDNNKEVCSNSKDALV